MPRLTDVEVRLAAMDAQGVDVQLVSPSPSHYHYWADEDTAEKVCRLANEGTAAHCRPGSRTGCTAWASSPCSTRTSPSRRSTTPWTWACVGVEISSHAPGRELSDPAYEPFWTRAEETGAILFLHPFGCTLDERLDRWYLSNTVGQPTENAVALSHLIFSGVLDRHPGLKLVAAHGGGYLPTHIGRSDHAWPARHRRAAAARTRPAATSSSCTSTPSSTTPHVLRALIARGRP